MFSRGYLRLIDPIVEFYFLRLTNNSKTSWIKTIKIKKITSTMKAANLVAGV
ncbi:hypothetical protein I526_p005 (plasmid) [Lactiplantibacillus plantarum DOMLa]|nr:hypothetical protein I526_p005 [Lactiplantibacillus plantarum DOMLa]